MAKQIRTPFSVLYPLPLALATSQTAEKKNIITLAWMSTVCADPLLISISIRSTRYSHELIRDSKEFVLNIPTVDLIWEVDYCGFVSGRDVDKFELTHFTPLKAKIVKAPLIEECPINIECRVKQRVILGTHDLFISEVLFVHIDESVMSERGEIDYTKLQPIIYIHHEYWSMGKKIGVYGFSRYVEKEKKK